MERNIIPKVGQSLADKYPELCKDWSDKNTLGPNQYTYGSKKKVWWKCHKCSHEWQQNPQNRSIGNNGCPQCSGRILSDFNRLSVRYPKLALEWDYNKNHPLRPEDISFGVRKRLWWICPDCKHSYESLLNSRTANKTGCPKCNMSHGERKIKEFLLSNNIKHDQQYRIKECKHKQPLPFDFAIWINDKLSLIEYNGEQHYTVDRRRYGSKDNLVLIQTRDKLKKDYCEQNNIPLLVIPYIKLNQIEEILDEFIKTQGIGGV